MAHDTLIARQLWHGLETVNAVTYFSPECTTDAPQALGLKGFWMGYFANRASPLGAVGPGVVEATFYNFHPDRVRRAIPDAWEYASPEAVLESRCVAAANALRRILGDEAEDLAQGAAPLLRQVIERAGAQGRPLFAANRGVLTDLAGSAGAVGELWQAATTLREHRGDAHVALLVSDDLDGCEVHVLAASLNGVDPELYQASRGWSPDDWAAAVDRLATRGLVDEDVGATSTGRDVLDRIERRTDELALRPFATVDPDRLAGLNDMLRAAAATIAAAGDIRFPNPMGLPAPEST